MINQKIPYTLINLEKVKYISEDLMNLIFQNKMDMNNSSSYDPIHLHIYRNDILNELADFILLLKYQF